MDIGIGKAVGVDTDDGSKLSKEGSVDGSGINDPDSEYCSISASGSSPSESISKFSYINEWESNTEEFIDD